MEQVKRMLVLTEPFPDGQRITAAVIEFCEPIAGDSLQPGDFTVADRTVTGIYANTEPKTAPPGKDGPFVIVALDPQERDSKTVRVTFGEGGPSEAHKGTPGGVKSVRGDIHLSVTQTRTLTAVSGALFPAFADAQTDGEINLISDEFQKLDFNGLKYSLFVPKDCDAAEKYPLVVFVPDATGVGSDPRISLEQGSGAVSFAAPEMQAKHPAFILSPQHNGNGPLTRDNFTVDEVGFARIHDLVLHIMEAYPVDASRVYCTGQSMGCMTFCEMNSRYPELFAATLFAAGQWDPERMGKLKDKNFWILVSEHDAEAFPGMNAVVEALEASGGRVGRYYWNAKAGKEALNAAAKEAMAEPYNLRYTVFEGDPVVPDGENASPDSNHMNTWPVVYSIDALKDWLFSCDKEKGAGKC